MFKRFKTWYLKEANEARNQNMQFPNVDQFVKWQWDDASPTGPYLTECQWWARSTLTWVQEHLALGTFPREDYRELCELLNVVLGGEVSYNIFYYMYNIYGVPINI